jgi:hypothetical protein
LHFSEGLFWVAFLERDFGGLFGCVCKHQFHLVKAKTKNVLVALNEVSCVKFRYSSTPTSRRMMTAQPLANSLIYFDKIGKKEN